MKKAREMRAFRLQVVRREGSIFASYKDGDTAFMQDGGVGLRNLDAETKSLCIFHAEIQMV